MTKMMSRAQYKFISWDFVGWDFVGWDFVGWDLFQLPIYMLMMMPMVSELATLGSARDLFVGALVAQT